MKTAIVALCIASANAAHVLHRKRNINVEYKSINTEGRRLAGDEEYEPYLGMERDLMSMSMADMSMSMPSMTEVDTMSTEESSAVSAGSAVSVLAIAGAMMLL